MPQKENFNQLEFRKDITEVINKYFNNEFELTIDEVLKLFYLGYKVKYKKEIQNYKEFKEQLNDINL